MPASKEVKPEGATDDPATATTTATAPAPPFPPFTPAHGPFSCGALWWWRTPCLEDAISAGEAVRGHAGSAWLDLTNGATTASTLTMLRLPAPLTRRLGHDRVHWLARWRRSGAQTFST